MLTITVYLSTVGLGLLALPREVVAAIATPVQSPTQTVAGILGAVDGGAQATGWYMRGQLAAPATVNLGALSLIWSKSNTSDLLGVRLGVLNTTAPLTCDGKSHVILQLDTQVGDYSAKFSRIGGNTETSAARVEYVCTQP